MTSLPFTGNGLADRMQHAPWVETLLQNHLQGMDVRFRNMSFSGDTVDRKPRSKGFTDDEAYLQHVGPSVIFIMYGYNESFAGEQGESQYKQQLIDLVEKYRRLRKEKAVAFSLSSSALLPMNKRAAQIFLMAPNSTRT